MGFKIGLDLPGEAWSAFLNPRSPFAAAAPYLGKMLGGAIDLIGGFPNEELRGSAWEHERAKAAYAKDKGDESVFVDEFGNISETPIPDSNYGGQAGSDLARAGSSRLFQNEMFDTPQEPPPQGYGGVAQHLRSTTPGFLNAEDAAFEGWMKESGISCGPDDDG